jgi:predicted site-specific integrase-resolvase
MSEIKLCRLSEAAGLELRTVRRWCESGVIRSTNRGVGRGNGFVLDREAATELLALWMLRRAGVPFQRLRATVKELRRAGKRGRDFLALGADGRMVLMDGSGDECPLRDTRGQTVLFVRLDLRPMRQDIERIVSELESKKPLARVARAAIERRAGTTRHD